MSIFNNFGHSDRSIHLQGNQGPIHIGGAAPPDPVAAQKRLAELPLDVVPDPAALSVPHRLVFEPNPLFVGRDADLKELARRLKAGGATAIVPAVVATGLGGLGKTQLATEFAHRYGHYFAGGVFWVTMADAIMAEAEVAACATALGMTEGSIGEKAEFVLSSWSQALPCLLIFDNCEDEGLLRRWRPKGGAARLLVTARRQEWSPTLGVIPHALAVLSRPDAVAMLCGYRPDLSPDDAALADIAAELGDLPLALHMAGSYLYRYRHSPGLGSPVAYLTALRAGSPLAHASLQGCRDASPTGYDRHVAAAFALSYERLHPTDDELARTLLAAAACCAPGEPIPRWLLTDTAIRLDPAPEAMAVEDALARLVELGLVKLEEQGDLTLHRLLAAFVGAVGDVAAVREKLCDVVLARADEQLDAGYPAPLIAWETHFEWVTRTADRVGVQFTLMDCLGTFYQMTGRYALARPLLERALLSAETVLGLNNSVVAVILGHLGTVLNDMGFPSEARPLLERALWIAEAAFGQDHPKVAVSLANLAMALRYMGFPSEARPLLERALQIKEAVYGRNHTSVAVTLSNLARVLIDLGSASEARRLLERAISIDETVLGPEHPGLAVSLANLASVLTVQGLPSEALPFLERALTIHELAYGNNHPIVAAGLGRLAMLLVDLGRPSEARPLLERALWIDETAFGRNHRRVAVGLSNLALVFRHLGISAAARPLVQRALQITEAANGPEHPDVASCLNCLTLVLLDLGLACEARSIAERALRIVEIVHDVDHPIVAVCLGNLAMVLRGLHLLHEARPLLERALRMKESAHGPDHPKIAISLSNLALVLQALGEASEARPLLERALSIATARLGPDHPQTISYRNNLKNLPRS